jgi:TRAP-type mannitol/chloroaromatic compound transport system substrate-binding protein
MTDIQKDGARASRRKFLQVTGLGAAAAVAAPSVVKAQGPTSMRWQSTWPSKDIFHEYALDFAKKVNDMTGGDLKIEVLPAGAVVPAFQLLDAVSSGTLDGGHGVAVYHYGKAPALALWGSGPGFGMDANMLLAWHKYGGGKELLDKIYTRSAPTCARSCTGRCRRSRSAGSRSRSPARGPAGLKFRTGRHLDRRVHGHGAAVNALPGRRDRVAMDRGLLDAAEFNNAPRTACSASRRVQDLHAAELPPERRAVRDPVQQGKVRRPAREMRAIITNAVGSASQDMSWKAIDRYSKDYIEMQQKDGVRFFKTPDAILKRQLEVYDEVVKKKVAENPIFKEVIQSQIAFAERATRWEQDTVVNRRMAFDHYFGQNAAAKKI